MSQPSDPGPPPGFEPPSGYGGYGGDLQSFGRPTPPATVSGWSPQLPPAQAAAPSVPFSHAPVLPAPLPFGLSPQAPAGQGSWGPHPVPPPFASWPAPVPAAAPRQRPAAVAMAATMAATASLQWLCALSFLWLVAASAADELGTSGVDGGFYHLLNRVNDRLLDGLAWPLYLFPTASLALALALPSRSRRVRLVFSATGVAALGWSLWWLRNDLAWWLPAATYVAATVLIAWTPAATAWYGAGSDPASQRR